MCYEPQTHAYPSTMRRAYPDASSNCCRKDRTSLAVLRTRSRCRFVSPNTGSCFCRHSRQILITYRTRSHHKPLKPLKHPCHSFKVHFYIGQIKISFVHHRGTLNNFQFSSHFGVGSKVITEAWKCCLDPLSLPKVQVRLVRLTSWKFPSVRASSIFTRA